MMSAISYMETQQWDKAIPYFQRLIDQKDVIFENHARWYLALLYFNTGKEDEAKALLRQIASTPGAYKQKEAQAILGE